MSRERGVCPYCGGELAPRGHCVRGVIGADGRKVLYELRVLRCRACHREHRELPAVALPYRHYSAAAIQSTLDAPSPRECDCVADESTLRRWRSEYARAFGVRASALVSCAAALTGTVVSFWRAGRMLSEARGARADWLSFVTRLLVNVGQRPRGCFAWCPCG